MPISAVVWLALLLASCTRAFALDPSLDISQYAHTAWKIRDGFTRGTINSIAQTPDGYLWLGTEFGLFRFDGVRAIPWSPPTGEQLASNEVGALLVGSDGTLWIGTHQGLSSLKGGKLVRHPEVAGQNVGSLVQDGEGTVWVGANRPGGLCAIRDGRVTCIRAGTFGDSVIALYEDHKNNLWVSAEAGVWRWAPGPPEHYTFPGGLVEARALIEGDRGELLMATAVRGGSPSTGSIEGLRQLVGGKIRSYAPPDLAGQFRPKVLFRTRDGSLWVGTVQGLLHLHKGRIDRFAAADGLSGDVIKSVFEDREGNVWVSTQDGLDRFRDYAVPTISLSQGLSSAAVYLVEAMPDGSIWIGTADGLDRWQNGHVTVYGREKASGRIGRTDKRELTISATVTEIGNSGLPGTPLALGQDDRGRLWASTREGVYYFELGRFRRVPGVPGGNIFSIAGDGHGKVWISNNDDGLFYSTPEGSFQRTPWARFGQKNGATALLPDRAPGALWLGFLDGRIAYLKGDQVRSSYSAADGLGEGSVNNLQLASDGAIWAATDGGLSRVKEGRISTLTRKNGLPCDAVLWAMEDNDHSVWLYMPCGLVRIARSELDAWVSDSTRAVQTTVFDSPDGVRSRATAGRYGPKVARSQDGKLWFPALDGLSIIEPTHLPVNTVPPPVHIEQITADGKKYDAARNLRLPARVRNVAIDFTALSLAVPEKVHFRFKLDGQDQNWREAVNQRRVEYSNLPPRNYRFRVTACNNSGVWNEAGDTVDFSVDPAYSETAWFRASLAAAVLVLLWALYRYRLYQVAREFNAQLEARIEERTRIARELHDTLLQSFQGLMLRFQVGIDLLPPGEAKETLEKALERGDQAIVEGRGAIHDLRSSTVTTKDLADSVRALRDELAPEDSASFSLVVEGPPRDLHPILRDEIYRIAREAARNAFRHAQAHRIEAEITYGEKLFRLRIRDDGRGMDPAVVEEGVAGHYGLPGMRERAARIGAQLSIWSGPGAGTEIELSVPGPIAYGTAPAHTWHWLFRKKVG